MRYALFIGFLFFHVGAFADSYAGCGVGVIQTGMTQSDWLKHSADDLAMAQCWLQTSPAIQAPGFFKALPSLHWQGAKPTTFSRTLSQDASRLQSLDAHWLFFRHGPLMFGITAGANDLKQQQPIKQELHWLAQNNLLVAGQPVSIRQQERFLGVVLDTHYTPRSFDQIRIKRHFYKLPLMISKDKQDHYLSDTKISTWQIELQKQPKGHGFLGYWALGLGSGEITSSVYPSADSLDSAYFISTELMLGVQWRHRVSLNLHPYLDVRGQASYWYFSENDNQTYHIDKTKQLSYQASMGLSWKF